MISLGSQHTIQSSMVIILLIMRKICEIHV